MKIQALPGVVPRSRQMLAQAGIHNLEQLREMGSVRAYRQVKHLAVDVSLNLLWPMEGVLSGREWREVARKDRLRLLMELDDVEHDERD